MTNKKILIPKPELLLAMKINSLPSRDKENKKIKDICDLFALAWYSDINLKEINFLKYIQEKNLKKCLKSIADDDLGKASSQIGHDKDELKRVFDALLSK